MSLQLHTSPIAIVVAILVFYQSEVIQSCLFRTAPLTKRVTTLYEADVVGEGIESSVSEQYESIQDRQKREASELQPNFELDYEAESFMRYSRRILNESEGGNATYKVKINGSEVDMPRPLKMLNVQYYEAKKKFLEKAVQNVTQNATTPDKPAAGTPAAPPAAAAAELPPPAADPAPADPAEGS